MEPMERLAIIAHPDTGERVGYVWKTGNAYAASSHLGYYETEEAAAEAVEAAAQGRALVSEMVRKMAEAKGQAAEAIEDLVAEGRAVPLYDTAKPVAYAEGDRLSEFEDEGKIERRVLWVLGPAQLLPHTSQKR